MTQLALFAAVRTVPSPFCAYTPHCGARASCGPCERVSEGCCNHAVTCLNCGVTGTESWNLSHGRAQHAKVYEAGA